MYKRIVVPLDGSSASNNALPYANTIAKATGATVVFLAVLVFSSARRQQRSWARAQSSRRYGNERPSPTRGGLSFARA